jgi:hypothetical protein
LIKAAQALYLGSHTTTEQHHKQQPNSYKTLYFAQTLQLLEDITLKLTLGLDAKCLYLPLTETETASETKLSCSDDHYRPPSSVLLGCDNPEDNRDRKDDSSNDSDLVHRLVSATAFHVDFTATAKPGTQGCATGLDQN